MRTVEEYMTLPYKMEIIPDSQEGGYAVSFPELPGCLTCADTLENALRNAEDAKRAWLTAALEDGIPVPEPADACRFQLHLPRSLHKQLAEHAKQEGISMNQYCLYLLAKYDTTSHAS